MIYIPVLRVDEIRIEPEDHTSKDFGQRCIIRYPDLFIVFGIYYEHAGILGRCIHHKSKFITKKPYRDDSSYLRCIEQFLNGQSYLEKEFHMSPCGENLSFDRTKFHFDFGSICDLDLKKLFQEVFHQKNSLPNASRNPQR